MALWSNANDHAISLGVAHVRAEERDQIHSCRNTQRRLAGLWRARSGQTPYCPGRDCTHSAAGRSALAERHCGYVQSGRAAAAGDNLIITHEPTFFDHLDISDQLPEKDIDPVLAAKRQFIAEHGLVIWRFHDHWHARNPDGIEAGMVHALGWEKFQDANNQYLFTIPETPLQKLAAEIKRKLGIHIIRVVGDPGLRITKLALAPGAAGLTRQAKALEMPGVQALVIGEAQEWEAVEYVADAGSEGRQKSLIILGHIPSEQAGMEECTSWLKTFVTEVPIQFVPAREPFWSPKP